MSGVSAFLWQAALLLIVAYFLGAWIGCFLRRLLSGPPKVAMEADDLVPSRTGAGMAAAGAAVAAGAGLAAQQASTDRFSRALEGGEPATGSGSAPDNAPPAPKPFSSTDALEAAADPSPQAPEKVADQPPRQAFGAASDTVIARQNTGPGAAEPVVPPTVQDRPPTVQDNVETAARVSEPVAARTTPKPKLTPPMSAGEAAAVARREREAAARRVPPAEKPAAPRTPDLPTSAGTSGQAIVSAPIGSKSESNSSSVIAAGGVAASATAAATAIATGTATPTPIKADDFTKIAGILQADVDILRSAGVKTYGDIAGWSASDVRHMGELLGDKRRISRENWIEQAQLLHSGTATAFARRAGSLVAPRPAPPVAVATPKPEPAAAATDPAAPEPKSNEDHARPGAGAGPGGQSDTRDTATASSLAAQAAAAAAVAAAGAAATSDAAVEHVSTSVAAAMREDLQQIDGINAEVQHLLNQQGVTRISQIAHWSSKEEHRIDRLLGGMNRVHREGWVRQARTLSGYRDVEPRAETTRHVMPAVAAEALPPMAEIAGTELPESEVATSEPFEPSATEAEAAQPATPGSQSQDEESSGSAPTPQDPVRQAASVAASTNVVALNRPAAAPVSGLRSVKSEALTRKASATDTPDAGHDLKRIRGIGVLLEKRLRAMGYTSYEQIGAWTQADIDKVGQRLDIPGRIQRENWIEQARILSNGGQTEFSRRMDR